MYEGTDFWNLLLSFRQTLLKIFFTIWDVPVYLSLCLLSIAGLLHSNTIQPMWKSLGERGRLRCDVYNVPKKISVCQPYLRCTRPMLPTSISLAQPTCRWFNLILVHWFDISTWIKICFRKNESFLTLCTYSQENLIPVLMWPPCYTDYFFNHLHFPNRYNQTQNLQFNAAICRLKLMNTIWYSKKTFFLYFRDIFF